MIVYLFLCKLPIPTQFISPCFPDFHPDSKFLVDFLKNRKPSFLKRLTFFLSSGLETLTTLSLLPFLNNSPSIIAEDLPASESINRHRSSQIMCECPNELKMSLIYLSIKLIFLGLKNLFFRKALRKFGEAKEIMICNVAQTKVHTNLVGIEKEGVELEEKESRKYNEKKEKGGEITRLGVHQMKMNKKIEGIYGNEEEVGDRVGEKFFLFDNGEELRIELGLEIKNHIQIDFERDPDCLNVELLERMQGLVDEFVIRNKNCIQMKTSYERDEKMFENALFTSTGEKVLVIVGMMHLDGWRYMVEQLNKKKEEEGKSEKSIIEKEKKREDGWEDVVRQMEEGERRRKEVMSKVSRSTTMKFCHEKTCKT